MPRRANDPLLGLLVAFALAAGCGETYIPPTAAQRQAQQVEQRLLARREALGEFRGQFGRRREVVERLYKELLDTLAAEKPELEEATRTELEDYRKQIPQWATAEFEKLTNIADRLEGEEQTDLAVAFLLDFDPAFRDSPEAAKLRERIAKMHRAGGGDKALLEHFEGDVLPQYRQDLEFERALGLVELVAGHPVWSVHEVGQRIAALKGEIEKEQQAFLERYKDKGLPSWKNLTGEDIDACWEIHGQSDDSQPKIWKMDGRELYGENDTDATQAFVEAVQGDQSWADYYVRFRFKLKKGNFTICARKKREASGRYSWGEMRDIGSEHRWDADTWYLMELRVIGGRADWFCPEVGKRGGAGLSDYEAGPVGFIIEPGSELRIKDAMVKVYRSVEVKEEELPGTDGQGEGEGGEGETPGGEEPGGEEPGGDEPGGEEPGGEEPGGEEPGGEEPGGEGD